MVRTYIMATQLHLHANFPYLIEIPNAALGYLKSALSEGNEKMDVTNIYWYLPPQEILESIFSIVARFQDRYVDIFEPYTVFTIYLSRFFFTNKKKKMLTPTTAGSLIGSYASQEKVKKIGQNFKDFIDYSIENENMADVDMAGFTVNFYQWILNSYVWSQLKTLNPNIKIVVGGLATKNDAEAFMNAFRDVDYCIWGEGEIPLKKLVNYDDGLSEVPRLIYRDNGALVSTDVSGDYRLNPLPFADHIDYFKTIEKFDLDVSPMIPIIGVRSCRWNRCKFCGVNKGVTYYERPVKEIIEEIEYQSTTWNTNKCAFLDTDFGRKRDADFEMLLTELLESVDRRKKQYHIWATVSPIMFTRKYAQMMSKITMHIQIGFEALTDSLLKSMNKMHGFAENIQALKFARDYNLDISGNNIIRNLPGERVEDVIESMENLKFMRFVLPLYHLIPSELSLYQGTEYYEETPAKEREKKWVVNILYDEIERGAPIGEDNKWDFFGFRAETIHHHILWDQFNHLLKEYQEAEISYTWLEFKDGSSLIEESNRFSGNKTYLLNKEETRILKICDSMKHTAQVLRECNLSEDCLEDIVSQLEGVNLLYVDRGKGRLISIPSIEDMRRIDERR
jgi:radical SAM superfamily enzyme YgiQ (UPF0313 family)